MVLTQLPTTDDNPGMDEKSKQVGSAGPALVVAAILVALPVLYVLSIGPVVWLDSKSQFSEPTRTVLECFYSPVGLAVESDVPFLGSALEAYVDWCG